MKIIKSIVWKLLNIFNLDGLVELALKVNFLNQKGWFKSYNLKQSIDKNGNPIPWCTYSFISFIENRLSKKMDIFEFGCGNSTKWFAKKVKSIKSVEHDKIWFEKIKNQIPTNAVIIYKELIYKGDYSKEVLKEKKKYHLIFIDGRDRNNSVYNSVKKLTLDGVIVFDNSQLSEYDDALNFLRKNNFKRLDFWGQIPIAAHENCTTIFYKTKNCLGI